MRASMDAFDAPATPITNEVLVNSASSNARANRVLARSTSAASIASPAQYHV
jgi:hypothetical protein